MSKLTKVLISLSVLFSAILAYAYFSSPLQPLAWRPAPNPGFSGDFAVNDYLTRVEQIPVGGEGAEDVTMAADGALYTGVQDGRILRVANGVVTEFVNTGGRPLGLGFDAEGNLIVADAFKGLLSVSPGGVITTLVDEFNGKKLMFTDDLDIADDGTIWFSDASTRWDQHNYLRDLLEMQPTGRVFSYDPNSGKTQLHFDGLNFANGIALGPDDAFLLVNETWRARVWRLWLKGPRTGEKELFGPNLPAINDNLSFNGLDTFWIANPIPRSRDLEDIADMAGLRRMLGALPQEMLRPPGTYSMVIGLGLNGEVKYNLQAPGPYHTVTSVNQYGDDLYLGSLAMRAIGKIPVPTSSNTARLNSTENAQ